VSALTRRTMLAGSAGAVFSTVLLPGGVAAAAQGRKRAYVLVVDGCKPDEITPMLTPTLAALRAGGLRHPQAHSMPVMETIPNHVMMMTGVRPDRSGVPANVIYDRELGDTRTLDRARDLRADTVIERLNRSGFTTGTVLSKEYLYGIFGGRATYRWEPAPVIPVSGHAPDLATMDATLAMVTDHDPNLVFVNLGDVDRVGHTDFTGPLDARLAREAALRSTDLQVGRLVDQLTSSGAWEHSVVIVLADHSMDWSAPEATVSVRSAIEADPMLAGKVAIAENGGAELLYWLGRDRDRDEAVARIREAARSVDGVLHAHPRTKRFLRLGPEAGDVVLYCDAGRRFSEDPGSNPIPGNHGHPATIPIPFFIGGGHPVVPRRRASSVQAQTVDVAPTVARFFGVGAPQGGYDGANRL
jgi:arylsulfatase A-like enzyme